MRTRITLAASFALLLVAGCGKTEDQAAAPAAQPQWLLTTMPEGARSVGDLKKSAVEGDQVVMRARVGGRMNPVTKDSAVFVVVDSAIPSCADIAGDNCPTPWDYCCEPKETLSANTATVQVVGDKQQPLAIDLTSQGLKPLQEVIVVGTVAPRPNDAVLIIRASAMHILPLALPGAPEPLQ